MARTMFPSARLLVEWRHPSARLLPVLHPEAAVDHGPGMAEDALQACIFFDEAARRVTHNGGSGQWPVPGMATPGSKRGVSRLRGGGHRPACGSAVLSPGRGSPRGAKRGGATTGLPALHSGSSYHGHNARTG
ncbi:unnamed protein product [Triticum turgidum subsp. durum]|uniref:Uncharacterized protein n=1 Tax=Triticum turgidum subsp. durum TaxID=4567 RepID=A0A9R0YMG6_TRITD|nr:unnamed protein product [Triticum turgidum subsp. durum]